MYRKKLFFVVFLLLLGFATALSFFSFRIENVKQVSAFKEIPYNFPVSIISFPSKGIIFWGTADSWGDKHVAWGQYKNIDEVIAWRNEYFESNDRIPSWLNDISQSPVSDKYRPIETADYIQKLKLSKHFIELLPKDILPAHKKGTYGECILVHRNIDNNERKYIEIYVTQGYFFFYFSHFKKQSELSKQ